MQRFYDPARMSFDIFVRQAAVEMAYSFLAGFLVADGLEASFLQHIESTAKLKVEQFCEPFTREPHNESNNLIAEGLQAAQEFFDLLQTDRTPKH